MIQAQSLCLLTIPFDKQRFSIQRMIAANLRHWRPINSSPKIHDLNPLKISLEDTSKNFSPFLIKRLPVFLEYLGQELNCATFRIVDLIVISTNLQ